MSDGELAPVDYAIIAFHGNQFTGKIAPALVDLIDREVIRVMDLVFVTKDENGETAAQELSDISEEVQVALARDGGSSQGLFNEEDLEAAAEELEPNSSAALIVWENLWAGRLADAVRTSGGELLDFGRIPHEIVEAAREWAVENANAE